MKIGYVTVGGYPPDPEWGGITTYLANIAPAIRKKGHSVTVVCAYKETPSVDFVDGVRVLRLINRNGRTQVNGQVAAILENEIRDKTIDLVEFAEYGGHGADFQKRNGNFPVTVRLHAPTEIVYYGSLPRWRRWVNYIYIPKRLREISRLERYSVENAKSMTAPSEWIQRRLADLGWQLPVARRTVANPFLRPETGRFQDVVLEEENTIVLLGRLCRLKGADMYTDVIKNVMARVPSARFVIIGQDGQKSRQVSWWKHIETALPRHVLSRVSYLGGIENAKLSKILRQFSIAAFMSVEENFPYTVLECMAEGLACVVGSGGGGQEMGVSGESVVNVDRNSVSVSSAIVGLLENNELRKAIQAQAKLKAAEYSPEVVAVTMEQVYLATIQRR